MGLTTDRPRTRPYLVAGQAPLNFSRNMVTVMPLNTRLLSEIAFWGLVRLARPVGGIRPRRIYHWLARHAFPGVEFNWYSDAWGSVLLLSPHFALDRLIIATGSFDPDLHRFLEHRLRPGMICMDIGANIGTVTVHMARKVRPEGTVFAFEPIPHIYNRLLGNVAKNGLESIVRPYSSAVSNRDGVARISFATDSTENQGMASLVNLSNEVATFVSEVSTVTLDTFCRQEGINRLDLIKVDAQGAETLVLEGAASILNQMSPDLLLECSPIDLACIGKTAKDLCTILEGLGYAIYSLKRGGIGERIYADRVAPDFTTDNVFCTKRGTH